MGQKRNWTADEYRYLEENWGIVSLNRIAKKLNRSKTAIKIKVQRKGLGAFLQNGEYVTVNQLFKAIGKDSSNGYAEYSWIKNRGFPVKLKRVENCSFKIIYIDDFWKWAEQHRNFIDWSKFNENALGREPNWVDAQRRLCINTKNKYHTTPWTKEEDSRLILLLKQYRYTVDELSKRIGRTDGAIQRRCCELKIKERPLKADNHKLWSNEEHFQLEKLIKQGYNYELLAEIFNRSSKAIRGRIYNMYSTENLDKVRALIGIGK